jgi:hypothetical protein
LYADKMGYSIKFEHHFQLIADGRWQDAAVVTASSWNLLKEWGKGTINVGWAYELRDADRNVLTSESESRDLIASSGSDEISLKDRCQIRSDLVAAGADAVVAVCYNACKIGTLGIPDVVETDLDLDKLGVGASIKGIKNLNLCENIKGSQDKALKLGAAWVLDDCVNHPGNYFPSDYPPEEDSLTLLILPGYEPAYGILLADGQTPANCPASYVNHEVVDMGDGTECAGDVRYHCETTTSGTCECDDPQVEGSITCTELNPR